MFNEDKKSGDILDYLFNNISEISTKYNGFYEIDKMAGKISLKKYNEVIPEVLTKNENSKTKFTEEFVKNVRGRLNDKL